MDQLLAKRLNDLSKQNEKLFEYEAMYLELEANKKPLLASLIMQAQGKSFAERETAALSSQEYRDFIKGLVTAEADYLFEKRRYGILESAFQAEYGSFKRDAELISKHKVE